MIKEGKMKDFIISVIIASVFIALAVWGFSKLPKPNYPERQELFFKCLQNAPASARDGNAVYECGRASIYLSKDM